ncbi:hypothetical protein VP01_118g2 [Puccinia sorghi]|uniref:Uncharacterized protein n=1 Tax=Puccinia sorghi TaxID=27349 RepID=A0A0L6VQU4_9BASI|nr:hypothetical protein VP01_118g2 [Puccinia sorghi]
MKSSFPSLLNSLPLSIQDYLDTFWLTQGTTQHNYMHMVWNPTVPNVKWNNEWKLMVMLEIFSELERQLIQSPWHYSHHPTYWCGMLIYGCAFVFHTSEHELNIHFTTFLNLVTVLCFFCFTCSLFSFVIFHIFFLPHSQLKPSTQSTLNLTSIHLNLNSSSNHSQSSLLSFNLSSFVESSYFLLQTSFILQPFYQPHLFMPTIGHFSSSLTSQILSLIFFYECIPYNSYDKHNGNYTSPLMPNYGKHARVVPTDGISTPSFIIILPCIYFLDFTDMITIKKEFSCVFFIYLSPLVMNPEHESNLICLFQTKNHLSVPSYKPIKGTGTFFFHISLSQSGSHLLSVSAPILPLLICLIFELKLRIRFSDVTGKYKIGFFFTNWKNSIRFTTVQGWIWIKGKEFNSTYNHNHNSPITSRILSPILIIFPIPPASSMYNCPRPSSQKTSILGHKYSFLVILNSHLYIIFLVYTSLLFWFLHNNMAALTWMWKMNVRTLDYGTVYVTKFCWNIQNKCEIYVKVVDVSVGKVRFICLYCLSVEKNVKLMKTILTGKYDSYPRLHPPGHEARKRNNFINVAVILFQDNSTQYGLRADPKKRFSLTAKDWTPQQIKNIIMVPWGMLLQRKKTGFTHILLFFHLKAARIDIVSPFVEKIIIEDNFLIIRPPKSLPLPDEAIPGCKKWLWLLPSHGHNDYGFSPSDQINFHLPFRHFPGQSTKRIDILSPGGHTEPISRENKFLVLRTCQSSLEEEGSGAETFSNKVSRKGNRNPVNSIKRHMRITEGSLEMVKSLVQNPQQRIFNVLFISIFILHCPIHISHEIINFEPHFSQHTASWSFTPGNPNCVSWGNQNSGCEGLFFSCAKVLQDLLEEYLKPLSTGQSNPKRKTHQSTEGGAGCQLWLPQIIDRSIGFVCLASLRMWKKTVFKDNMIKDELLRLDNQERIVTMSKLEFWKTDSCNLIEYNEKTPTDQRVHSQVWGLSGKKPEGQRFNSLELFITGNLFTYILAKDRNNQQNRRKKEQIKKKELKSKVAVLPIGPSTLINQLTEKNSPLHKGKKTATHFFKFCPKYWKPRQKLQKQASKEKIKLNCKNHHSLLKKTKAHPIRTDFLKNTVQFPFLQ